MAAIKAYTNIEQSKKLAEILPLESADMCYKCIGEDPYDVCLRPYSEWKEEYKGLLVGKEADVIPCWSLVALFEVIPKYIGDNYVLRMGYNKDFGIWYDEDDEVGCGVSIELPDITNDSIIDACYEMILKLHEANLI